MAEVVLNGSSTTFSDGYDIIIIPSYFDGKVGGVALDVTGFSQTSIRAGHVIIKETATGEYKPMPVTGSGASRVYGSLPGGHVYAGHAVQSVMTDKAAVGVLDRGKVNHLVVDPAAGVYDMAPILTALKAALPLVQYKGDNE